MYEIIEKPPLEQPFQAMFGGTCISIPCYCILPDGREVFIINRSEEVVDKRNGVRLSVPLEVKQSKMELDDFVEQLKQNDGKWFDRYSLSRWYNDRVKGMDPLRFVKWVNDQGYSFDTEMTELDMEDEKSARFQGNLNEYCCSFCYDIFDKAMIQEIIASVSGLQVHKL